MVKNLGGICFEEEVNCPLISQSDEPGMYPKKPHNGIHDVTSTSFTDFFMIFVTVNNMKRRNPFGNHRNGNLWLS